MTAINAVLGKMGLRRRRGPRMAESDFIHLSKALQELGQAIDNYKKELGNYKNLDKGLQELGQAINEMAAQRSCR